MKTVPHLSLSMSMNEFYFHVNYVLVPGIKKYIVGLIIKSSSEPETMEREKIYLNKLNMILVQVTEKSSINECVLFSCPVL